MMCQNSRYQDPEATQRSPGLVFPPPESSTLVSIVPISCQSHLRDFIPSLRFASCSDPNASVLCGQLSINQPPLSIPLHLIPSLSFPQSMWAPFTTLPHFFRFLKLLTLPNYVHACIYSSLYLAIPLRLAWLFVLWCHLYFASCNVL